MRTGTTTAGSSTTTATPMAPDAASPTPSGGAFPTYRWRCAPDGLATRRQLAADGLRPGHQPIAGQILWRGGDRVAYLYRRDAAEPKRAATSAQLAALDKAMRVRRTCPSCQQDVGYVLPRRWAACLDCQDQIHDAQAHDEQTADRSTPREGTRMPRTREAILADLAVSDATLTTLHEAARTASIEGHHDQADVYVDTLDEATHHRNALLDELYAVDDRAANDALASAISDTEQQIITLIRAADPTGSQHLTDAEILAAVQDLTPSDNADGYQHGDEAASEGATAMSADTAEDTDVWEA